MVIAGQWNIGHSPVYKVEELMPTLDDGNIKQVDKHNRPLSSASRYIDASMNRNTGSAREPTVIVASMVVSVDRRHCNQMEQGAHTLQLPLRLN